MLSAFFRYISFCCSECHRFRHSSLQKAVRLSRASVTVTSAPHCLHRKVYDSASGSVFFLCFQ